jgi:hypothetical protein
MNSGSFGMETQTSSSMRASTGPSGLAGVASGLVAGSGSGATSAGSASASAEGVVLIDETEQQQQQQQRQQQQQQQQQSAEQERLVIWYLNISELGRADTETVVGQDDEDVRWNYCLTKLLSEEEKNNVLKYVFVEDQRRAAGSVLLQKALIRKTFGFDSDLDFVISRTAEVLHSIDVSVCLQYPVLKVRVCV